ncbi:hypothetical protein EW026_g858 [Hermanssonia centrifuga]|uniref:DUF6534 domain-containing protein n=1 Tax=Hermanssonia centrifuga TaxID=98765 RepID=A0A4S4KTD2_9APHY|nr:hypothetical protein EW026_g858 [Hermanssonia centrifuga]
MFEEPNSTFGVLFIGFILGVTLYGLTFFQTYVFFSRFPHENVWTKCVVGLLSLIDTATTALISHMQYFYLVTRFVAPFDSLEVTRTFMVSLRARYDAYPFDYILIQVEKGLAYKVLSLAASVQLSSRQLISNLITPDLQITIGLGEGLATTSDILVLAAHYYYLRAARRPGMKITKDRFQKVVLHVINRGTLFTIIQAVLFLTFVTMPHSQIWILFHFIISKEYINGLFSMLNSRRASRGRGIYEEQDLIVPYQGLKKPGAPGEFNEIRFNGVDDQRHRQTLTVELSPMTSRSEMGDSDVRARSSIDADSELRTPTSM